MGNFLFERKIGDPGTGIGTGYVSPGHNSAYYDPATGKQRWVNTEPTYAIESRPWVEGSTVYYGSWDGNVYALDAATGRTRWKVQGAGSAAYPPGLVRYYAPADAGPATARPARSGGSATRSRSPPPRTGATSVAGGPRATCHPTPGAGPGGAGSQPARP